MLFQDASKATVSVTVGETTHVIPMLTLRKASELLESWAARQRSGMVRNMKDAGAPAPEIIMALTEFDKRAKSMGFVIGWCANIDFAVLTIEAASGKPIADTLPANASVFDLAMRLWGFDTRESDAEGNPQAQANSATG